MDTLAAQERVPDRIFPLSGKQRQFLITSTLVAGDLIFLCLSFALAYFLRFQLLPYQRTPNLEDYFFLLLWTIPLWMIIFAFSQLYSKQILFGGLDEYVRMFTGVTIGTLVLMVFGFLQRDDVMVSRGWLVLAWLIAVICLIGWRFLFRHVIFEIRKRGHLLSPAVIVGFNNEGIALGQQLLNSSTSGLYIIGFIDNKAEIGTTDSNDVEVIAATDEISSLISEKKIEEVIIASSALNREQVLELFQKVTMIPGVNLRLSSGLFEIISTGMRVKELAYVPLIEVNKNRISGLDAAIKSLMDYIISICSIILLSPLLLLIALLIKIDSRGPVIHKRKVMGVNGTKFDAFKFRTMHIDGDEILAKYPDLLEKLDNQHKLIEDPRVTKIGNSLRKLSLDELPQLFNVLTGQMSLVGPRMISPPEMEEYQQWGMNLLTVKPGITGLWQVSGRSDVSYEERVRMDMQYIRNWTIWLDLYLLLATIPVVIYRKGAY
jgi:exopolysaccharide biosynthesis polyprenyl glycosylphosphotransferase